MKIFKLLTLSLTLYFTVHYWIEPKAVEASMVEGGWWKYRK